MGKRRLPGDAHDPGETKSAVGARRAPMEDMDMDVDEAQHLAEEVEDLRQEMERFKKEKEQVRAIVGKIGGVPTFNTTLFNTIFAVVVVGFFVASMVSHGVLRLAMIECAVAAVSLKIMVLIHKQSRVNHFQTWMLSSLEWRLDQIMRELKSGRE